MEKYKVQIEFWCKNNVGKSPDMKSTFNIYAANSNDCKTKVKTHTRNTLLSLTQEGNTFRKPIVKITKLG